MASLTDTRDEAEAVRLAAIRAHSPEDRNRDAVAISELVDAAIGQRQG